ncbi:MAG: 50S ribosomal protein L18e [archaeon]
MKRTGPTNIQLKKLIVDLRKLSAVQKVKLWKVISEELNRPTRIRREVSIGNIDKYSKTNETVIVPGKVLSNGELSHKVTVAALNFSKQAKEKINASGKTMSIQELMKANPKAQKVRILG